MICLISPAKTLDFESSSPIAKISEARFLDDSQSLIEQISKLTPEEIAKLMKLSENLSVLNWQRFQDWQLPFPSDKSKAAVFAFKGDVYTGLDAESLSEKEIATAQSSLRILSGLYGLLRPLDSILPYRLEMGTRFANDRGSNLYKFWGSAITDQLNADLAASGSDIVINLASNEYYKAVQAKNVKGTIITPVFKDLKNGDYKVISFYAKKARGMMAAYLIKNNIDSTEGIKSFSEAGYYYSEENSTPESPCFLRD